MGQMTKKYMLSWLTNECCYYETQYDAMQFWTITRLRQEVIEMQQSNIEAGKEF